MILGLVSYKFINNDIKFNINQIEKAIEQSKNVDMYALVKHSLT